MWQYGDIRKAFKISIREHEGERPLGRPRHSWKDNVKMHLKRNLGGKLWTGFIPLSYVRLLSLI
jgi:hypothetical protein